MTDRDALLAAIRADPDDDTARLVYADWAQENGQTERAEFIRAQIEAARAEPFGPQFRKAARRADELLKAHQLAWTRHLHGAFVEWPRFERGFVTQLAVEPIQFVPRAEALFDMEPVQALKLFRFASTGSPTPFGPVFELPRLRQIRRVELSSRLFSDEEEYRDLFGCRHLAGLRELALGDNPVPPQLLSALLRGDAFPELVGLELAGLPHLGPCLTESLAAADHRRLKRLDLTDVVFLSDQLQRVLTSRCLRQVEALHLGRTAAGQAGPLFYLELGFVIPWNRLAVLDLAGHWLGDEVVGKIAALREAASLRWLGLAYNGIGPDSVRYLTRSQHLALNHLDVRGNNLSLSDRAALQSRFPDAVIES
jgi:uncharacterized protein (TIGR02996 family)